MRYPRAHVGFGYGTIMAILWIAVSVLVRPEMPLAQLLPPASRYQWEVIRSDRFVVHFRSGNDSLAGAVLQTAEETYATFSEELGLRPRGQVEVFLQDSYDVVNSAASPILHRSIYIFPDQPYGMPYAQIGHCQNWIRLAFVHEYAHILDSERRSGLWSVVHALSGLGYPNLYRPLWTIEGFAVWAESRFAGGGRIGSPTTQMVVRSDVLAGRFRKPVEWSGAYEPWPDGTMPYLYGAAFMEYLERQYGPKAPDEYRDETSRAWPWSYAGSLTYVSRGRPFTLVLAEFYEASKRRMEEDLKWIRDQGPLVEGDLLSRPGTTILDMLPGADNRTLYIALNADKRAQRIISLDIDSGVLGEIEKTTGLDVRVSEDRAGGRLIYTDLDVEANSRLVSKLYSVRASGGGKRQISTVGRLHEPAIRPTDGALLACRRDQGRSLLVEVHPDAVAPVALGLPPAVSVFHPAWSSDGTRLAVSVLGPTGNQDIWLADYSSGRSRSLTSDEHQDITPVLSADGRFAVFCSDRTGIWNIYAIDTESSELFQVTNVTTGAFLPELSRDGKWLYFVRYSADGDEIRRLPFEASSWRAVALVGEPCLPGYLEYLGRTRAAFSNRVQASTALDSAEAPTFSRYTKGGSLSGSLRFLKPVARLPVPYADADGLGVGLLFAGSDPLGRTSYSGYTAYGFESERVTYSLVAQSYLLPRARLDVQVSDVSRQTGFSVYDTEDYFWKGTRTVGLSLAWPLLEVTRYLEIQTGMNIDSSEPLVSEAYRGESLQAPFSTGRSTEAFAGLVFSNAKRYPLSFSNEDGVFASAYFRTCQEYFGGQRTGSGGDADLRAYKRLTEDIVVAFRAVGTKGVATEIEFGPFGDISIAGQDSTLMVSRAAVGSAEIRVRVRETQTGIAWDWLFLNRIHAALFSELAVFDVGTGGETSWDNGYSVGGRISFDTTIGFMFPLTWDLIVASPSLGRTKAYLGLMTAF